LETKRVEKVHKFFMRKPLECSNGENNIIIPHGYIFSAKSKAYQKNGKEFIDFDVQADQDIFKESVYFQGVPCDYVRFLD